MGIIRRGNYIFKTLIADHGNHVHIYRNGTEVCKWNLEKMRPEKGQPSRRMLKIINQLVKENAFRFKI